MSIHLLFLFWCYFSYWAGLKTVLYVPNREFFKGSLKCDLSIQKSFCGYVEVSSDFRQQSGDTFGGIGRTVWDFNSQENQLFEWENWSTFWKFDGSSKFMWKVGFYFGNLTFSFFSQFNVAHSVGQLVFPNYFSWQFRPFFFSFPFEVQNLNSLTSRIWMLSISDIHFPQRRTTLQTGHKKVCFLSRFEEFVTRQVESIVFLITVSGLV